MARVIRRKMKSNPEQDKELAQMFNQMIGTDNVDVSIAYPRYQKIKDAVGQLISLFEIWSKSPAFSSEKWNSCDFHF